MDEPTCGKGLAENSVLPAKFGEVVAAVADNLEVHMEALDLEDDDAKEEHQAYGKLVEEHRRIAAQLKAMGEEMAGYRDLPMGRHDHKAMVSAEVAEAFQKLVRLEHELSEMLQARAKSHNQILNAFEAAGARP